MFTKTIKLNMMEVRYQVQVSQRWLFYVLVITFAPRSKVVGIYKYRSERWTWQDSHEKLLLTKDVVYIQYEIH